MSKQVEKSMLLNRLLKRLPEQYQDISFNGKLYKGRRECSKRFDLIAPLFQPHDTVMDLGSSLGYYSHRLAKFLPDTLIVSFESDPIMVEIQKKIFKEEGIYNVIVCQHRLEAKDLVKWASCVEFFDKVIALSVLHHYPYPEVATAYNSLLTLSDNIIGEIPHKDEEKACGFETTKKMWQMLGEKTVLGTCVSHLDGDREIWVKTNTVKREKLDAFIGVEHEDRHRFTAHENTLNGKHIIKGLNLWNLHQFNIQWPDPKWWHSQIKSAYTMDKKSDVKPWNLLVTSNGLRAIDFSTSFPQGDQAYYKEGDIDEICKLFS